MPSSSSLTPQTRTGRKAAQITPLYQRYRLILRRSERGGWREEKPAPWSETSSSYRAAGRSSRRGLRSRWRLWPAGPELWGSSPPAAPYCRRKRDPRHWDLHQNLHLCLWHREAAETWCDSELSVWRQLLSGGNQRRWRNHAQMESWAQGGKLRCMGLRFTAKHRSY